MCSWTWLRPAEHAGAVRGGHGRDAPAVPSIPGSETASAPGPLRLPRPGPQPGRVGPLGTALPLRRGRLGPGASAGLVAAAYGEDATMKNHASTFLPVLLAAAVACSRQPSAVFTQN